MTDLLKDRVALVTGAGQGIGRAIAARFLDHGAHLVLVERDEAAGRDAEQQLGTRGPVRLERLDVADPQAVAAAVTAAAQWRGRLDVVVNNAMTPAGWETPLTELDLDDWRRGLDVNLTGPMLVSRAAIPHLRRTRGCIINITSTRALMSEPHTETYAACKGGLTALTHALAISLGPDVRVNAIAPGWIATDAWKPSWERQPPELRAIDHAQHPAGRVGTPEDVAGMALYLASDDAGFVTGQIFTIDGGMTRKMIYAE